MYHTIGGMTFMFISYLFPLKSIYRESLGDFRPIEGKKVVKNIWNVKEQSDYLHHMRLESHQFAFHITFTLVCFKLIN